MDPTWLACERPGRSGRLRALEDAKREDMKTTWTGALLGASLLAGCTTGGAADSAVSTSVSASSTPSTSPTTTATPTTSPQDAAAAQAEEVLRAYYRAQTTCFADPVKSSLTCFDQVAIATELNNMHNALGGAKQMQTRVTGDIALLSVKRKSVDLMNNVAATPPVVPEVVLTVCTDVSNYNIVDKDGKSIVPSDRKPHVLVNASILNYKYPAPTQWRVGLVTPVKDGPC